MTMTTFPEYFTREDLKIDPPELRDRKIEALVSAMTMSEKFSLLGGTTRERSETPAISGAFRGSESRRP